MSQSEPLVSVVIPTVNRPQLVARAVNSALRQSLHAIEIIVVVDGPDDATFRALRTIDDPRLRVLPLRENGGPGAARHAAADGARGRWVALLDDDDEWLPQKLERQLDTALRSPHRWPIITCRVIARSERGDVVRPRRIPTQGERLSEYLFYKTRLRGGEGLILPSTLLAPRDLLCDTRLRFRRVPFEGSDWLLRIVEREGVGVEFVPTREPLAIWHCEDMRPRRSSTRNWRASLAWANTDAPFLTPRARASFILNLVSLDARRAGDTCALWQLPREAFRSGRPNLTSLLTHAIIWLLPLRTRFSIAAFINRRFPSHAAGAPAHRAALKVRSRAR
jgi:glycosyltransferase involved in cell wall biosynthesis